MLNKIACPAEFLLGSIAPDSVYNKPTYYDVPGKYNEYAIAHMIKPCFTEWKEVAKSFILDRANSDFHLGYGIHILTDIMWKESVYTDFTNIYKEQSRRIYYNDMKRLDFELYNMFDLASDVWKYLSNYEGTNLGITDETIAWKENTLRLFDIKEKYEPLVFFTLESLVKFIEMAVSDSL